ncbi:MAG: histidine kinase [Bacteroidota bacterium]
MGRLLLLLACLLPLGLGAQGLDSMLLAWERMPADTHKVQKGFRLGGQLMSRYPQWTHYLTDRALCLGDSLGFEKARFNAQMQYCYLAGKAGQWQEAHEHARQLLAFSERNPKANYRAVATAEMAQTALRLALPQTETYFIAALEAATAISKKSYLERVQYYYAIWLQDEGRYEEALTQLESVISAKGDTTARERRSLIPYYSMLGKLWLETEQPHKAEPYFRKAYAFRKERNHLPQIAVGEQNMGVYFSQSGQLDSAEYYFRLAIKHDRQIKNIMGLAASANNLAIVYEKKGELEKIRPLYQEAHSIYQTANESLSRVRTLLNWGLLEVKLGQTRLGLQYLRQGEAQAQEIGNVLLKRLAYKNLAEALQQQAKHKEAYQYLSKYHQVKDSTLSEERLLKLEKIEAKFEEEKAQKEVARLQESKLKQEAVLVQSRLQNDQFLPIIIVLILVIATALLLGWWFWHRQRLGQKAQETDLQQRLLRSQMNPHFLFNALNSIQRLFQDRDTERANEYLEGFGQLMNDILDQSGREWIPLVDELRTLELYLRMEQYRLENGFRYALHLPQGIDAYQTQVPPLILQPLVENAIWHGIAPLEKEGLIEINFSWNEGKLECQIVDNGVGLSHSQQKRHDRHQPKALNILNERLGIESAFQLRERKDTHGEILGTEAKLLIPVQISSGSLSTTK